MKPHYIWSWRNSIWCLQADCFHFCKKGFPAWFSPFKVSK